MYVLEIFGWLWEGVTPYSPPSTLKIEVSSTPLTLASGGKRTGGGKMVNVEELVQKIGTLEAEVNTLKEDVEVLKQDVNSLKDKLESIETKNDQILQTLRQLQQQQQQQQQRVDPMLLLADILKSKAEWDRFLEALYVFSGTRPWVRK